MATATLTFTGRVEATTAPTPSSEEALRVALITENPRYIGGRAGCVQEDERRG